mmetsp:Transcript_24425/g.76119  ORF Transcript_24425/g.76119 Transcript_24425/m.76119 type:complete len:261 (+) Transcript_24425:1175-1957(+)
MPWRLRSSYACAIASSGMRVSMRARSRSARSRISIGLQGSRLRPCAAMPVEALELGAASAMRDDLRAPAVAGAAALPPPPPHTPPPPARTVVAVVDELAVVTASPTEARRSEERTPARGPRSRGEGRDAGSMLAHMLWLRVGAHRAVAARSCADPAAADCRRAGEAVDSDTARVSGSTPGAPSRSPAGSVGPPLHPVAHDSAAPSGPHGRAAFAWPRCEAAAIAVSPGAMRACTSPSVDVGPAPARRSRSTTRLLCGRER